MKYILFATTFLFLTISANAQSVQVKDLSNSVGSWEGKLTYLDYASDKPFTMLANIKISLTADKKGFIMGYEYPKEPHANSKDTTFIVGNYFGKDKIVEFKKESSGDYKMITEIELIEKLRFALMDSNINENSNNSNTENWDSLGQLSVLATLSNLTSKESDKIADLRDAESVLEIVRILRVHNLLK